MNDDRTEFHENPSVSPNVIVGKYTHGYDIALNLHSIIKYVHGTKRKAAITELQLREKRIVYRKMCWS
jgi:hypothetical protein